MESMWFNSDIWFEMESVGQVTTYPHKTEVFTNTGDVITITFEDNDRTARVKRQRGDKVDIYFLGDAAVRYNLGKLKHYAKERDIYYDVTDPREWQSPVVEEGQTKDYKSVAAEKTEVVRGFENIAPYHRLTALCLPDGTVRLMRYGDRTYKVADQLRYVSWEEFVSTNNFVFEVVDNDEEYRERERLDILNGVLDADLSSVSDVDSSSDYEPEAEREFYRSQAQSRKRRRVEKTMTIRMAVGGGDDANVDEKLVDVDFQFGNMSTAKKMGKLYRIDFTNGAYMLFGKGTMTYVRSNGTSAWCEWKHPDDFREIAVWVWDQPGFERPAFE